MAERSPRQGHFPSEFSCAGQQRPQHNGLLSHLGNMQGYSSNRNSILVSAWHCPSSDAIIHAVNHFETQLDTNRATPSISHCNLWLNFENNVSVLFTATAEPQNSFKHYANKWHRLAPCICYALRTSWRFWLHRNSHMLSQKLFSSLSKQQEYDTASGTKWILHAYKSIKLFWQSYEKHQWPRIHQMVCLIFIGNMIDNWHEWSMHASFLCNLQLSRIQR